MRIPLAALLFVPAITLAAAEKTEKTAPKRDAAFCDSLAGFVKEAPTEFKSLEGAPRKNPKNHTSTKTLPGAKECTVFAKSDKHEAFLGCEIAETRDAEVAAASFKALTAKIRGCHPGKEWTVEEGEHDDGGGFWWSLTNTDESKPFFEVNDDIEDGVHTLGVDIIQPDEE